MVGGYHCLTTTPNLAEIALGMSTLKTDKYGNREWRNSEGQLHRLGGPAREWVNDSCEWWVNGQRHRTDGPAIEHASGYRAWYQTGQLHREDGPAVEYANGTREWFLNGQQHRSDGPAIEWNDGYREWYLIGEELTFADWLDKAATPQHQTLLRLRWT
jgi:hypothetical protein